MVNPTPISTTNNRSCKGNSMSSEGIKMATEKTKDYPGWTFRLSISNPNINDSAEARVSDHDLDLEGVQLLPKNRAPDGNDYGMLYSPLPSLSSSRYLAELCPHGVSVATLEGDVPVATVANDARNKVGRHQSRRWSWSYSSQASPSQWNVTSSKLLSVTYRPVHEAYPAYTNISKSREYWHRFVGSCLEKGAACACGKCRAFAVGHAGRKKNRRQKRCRIRWGKIKRRITGAPNPIHRATVNYTVDDILRIEPIAASSSSAAASASQHQDVLESGVWIQGIGNCHALRIYLRSKFDSNSKSNLQDDSTSIRNHDLPDLNKWDNLPLSPWINQDANSATEGGSQESKHWGPVLTFAIPYQGGDDDTQRDKAVHKCPPLLWKVEHPPNPFVAVDSFLLMDGALHLHQREKEVGWAQTASSSSYEQEKPTNVYINGYQSWSFSGSVVQGNAQPKSAMPNVLSAAFNRGGVVLSDDHANGSDYWSKNVEIQINDDNEDSDDDKLNEENAFYKSDMFACISSNGLASSQHDDERIVLDEEGGPAVIIGFLAQRHQYGSVLLDKDLRRFSLFSCHEGVVANRGIKSDWAYCQIVDRNTYDEEAMVYYVHAVGDHNEARPMEKGLTCGWCSWYHYYDDISHASLSKNAEILEKSMISLGFNVCLIDDGYMTAWGDWASLKPGKFVQDGGMRVLSDAIRAKGMKPGVWLAPFACDKFSTLAKDHPDWIIRNDMGRHANSANCGKFFYGLDATNPAVLKHVYDTIRRAVDEWGFEVLKLDFLYASCLAGNGKYDPSISRAEAMHLGLRTIRAAAGKETFIIGCGCPIGSAVGFVDGMRVSCDTGPTFVPPFPFPHWDNGTLPALRGMLRNTMSRSPFGHRWWHNDPDCILLGESTKLTDDEVVSAASVVAMTGGMFLLSDDMEKVSEARLSIAQRIFPLISVTAVPLDLHSTVNSGMPSILRLWCTEKSVEENSTEITVPESSTLCHTESGESPRKILREQASKIECEFIYSPGNMDVDPYSRERSCIRVASGLGSWTVVSLSNWLEHTAKLRVSFSALVSHSIDDFVATGAPRSLRSLTADSSSPREILEHGFHVFSFWSSEYVWIPHQTLEDNDPLIKKLKPHATEIFHIKPAEPSRAQYIGSDLHFSCGFEVDSFDWSDRHVKICLKNDYKKQGSIFLYVPESDGLNSAAVTVSGKPVRVEIVARPIMGENCGGRVLRVNVGTGDNEDGVVSILW